MRNGCVLAEQQPPRSDEHKTVISEGCVAFAVLVLCRHVRILQQDDARNCVHTPAARVLRLAFSRDAVSKKEC